MHALSFVAEIAASIPYCEQAICRDRRGTVTNDIWDDNKNANINFKKTK